MTTMPLLCWPHIARTAVSKNRSKHACSIYVEVAQKDFSTLHLCSSLAMFSRMSELMLQKWKNVGEILLADWAEREYLTYPYNR
jgi:hypothetical protein